MVPRAWTWMGRWDAYLIRSCVCLTAPAASTLLGTAWLAGGGRGAIFSRGRRGAARIPSTVGCPGTWNKCRSILGSLLLPWLPVATKYKNKIFKKNFSVQKVKLINQWGNILEMLTGFHFCFLTVPLPHHPLLHHRWTSTLRSSQFLPVLLETKQITKKRLLRCRYTLYLYTNIERAIKMLG